MAGDLDMAQLCLLAFLQLNITRASRDEALVHCSCVVLTNFICSCRVPRVMSCFCIQKPTALNYAAVQSITI